MDGKIALEEHFSTDLNNRLWDAKGEEERNGKAYAQKTQGKDQSGVLIHDVSMQTSSFWRNSHDLGGAHNRK